jgi:hypothetical protein
MCAYVIRCRLCFLSETECNCVLFQKLNANLVFYPAVTGELASACPSLLEVTVVTDVLILSRPSLLESTVATGGYHCSDIATDATVTYGSFLQWIDLSSLLIPSTYMCSFITSREVRVIFLGTHLSMFFIKKKESLNYRDRVTERARPNSQRTEKRKPNRGARNVPKTTQPTNRPLVES